MYKNFIEGKKAVAFDLDGTIAETKLFWYRAYSQVLGNLKVEYSDKIRVIYEEAGVGVNEIWSRIKNTGAIDKKITVEDLIKQTHKEYSNLITSNRIFTPEGFLELIFELKLKKKLKIGLTTNSAKKVAQLVLDNIGASEFFDAFVFGDEVKNRKPHPEIYKTIAKKLSVRPEEMLVFEDSITGAASAKKAGADVFVIWDGSVEKNEYPKGMLAFNEDFDGLAGNLDHTYKEAWEEYVKKFQEKQGPNQ